VQSQEAYRLYGTPKYIDERHVLLALVAIVVFALGARLDAAFSGVPRPTPIESDRVVRFWFWLTFVLALFGYVVWAGVGIRNGASLDMLSGLVSSDNADAEEIIRTELFPTLPGVTTCTHFSLPAVLLGLWLFIQGDRRVVWPMLLILFLAVVRALLWRERTAIIALAVPAAAIWLRTRLSRPLSPQSRAFWQFGPILGLVAMLIFFGVFEYFRSWQYYDRDFDSYPEFVLWRVGGYYTTALNNGAMALETQPPLPLPFWTLRPLWKFPGIDTTSYAYHALTGIDPHAAHLNMLEQYGTIELNNEGGLFMPIVDYGVFGFVVFWFVSGFIAGRLYRGYLAETLAGVMLYPIIFLAILETPLILYIFFPASFPALAVLVLAVWRAGRVAEVAPVVGPRSGGRIRIHQDRLTLRRPI
jgi:oligosaccharide repeat unit polymerase